MHSQKVYKSKHLLEHVLICTLSWDGDLCVFKEKTCTFMHTNPDSQHAHLWRSFIMYKNVCKHTTIPTQLYSQGSRCPRAQCISSGSHQTHLRFSLSNRKGASGGGGRETTWLSNPEINACQEHF